MKTKQILCSLFVILFSVFGQASVMTSFSVLHLITKELVTEDIDVIPLFKGQEDSHHFDLTPKTLIQMEKQDWIIVNGLGFEHWLPHLNKNLKVKAKLLIASGGINPKISGLSTIDPHAWLNLEYLEIYVNNISNALKKSHPQKSSDISLRQKKMIEKLKAWKLEQQQIFNSLPTNWCLISAHNSFFYLANYYSFTTIALMGDHDGEQLPPKQLIKNLEHIKSCKHKVFFGDGSTQDAAMKEWAKKMKASYGGVLWSDNVPNYQTETIWGYLEHNAHTIQKAFGP